MDLDLKKNGSQICFDETEKTQYVEGHLYSCIPGMVEADSIWQGC